MKQKSKKLSKILVTETQFGSLVNNVIDEEEKKRKLKEVIKRFSKFSGKSTPPEGWFEF